MARVGTSGCGFEHQLAATSKALTAPENAGFLRDDAFLQIVLITDEDDCSAPTDSDLFTRQFPDEEPSFRCARAGHACRGQMPPSADFSAPLAECKAVENGALSNVQGFVDQIRALKKDPGKVWSPASSAGPAVRGTYQVGKRTDPITGQIGAGITYPPARPQTGRPPPRCG
jgi:hypothetical protein